MWGRFIDSKTVFELFKKEMITVHNQKNVEEVGTKDKNNLKGKLWEKWKIVMLSDVESDMRAKFHSRFSF